jgi:hypothetical protein
MQKLIRGLLVTRHKQRWDYEKTKAYLAGEDIDVFQEAARDLPPFTVGSKKCHSFKEITQALLDNREEGKKIVFGQELKEYMWGLVGIGIDDNAQNDAEKISDLIETYSSKRKEDEGFIAVAYSLTPNLPFVVGRYKDDEGKEKNVEVRSMADIQKILETDPEILIPALRDEKEGFYAYLDVQGYGDAGIKVREVVDSTRSDLKLVPRLRVAFANNVITPFQDSVYNEKRLEDIKQLTDLPEHLKERIILFIEMKKDDVTAWIENLSGKDLDVWLDKYKNQKDKLVSWGAWRYFQLFLDGKDIQLHRSFSEGAGDKKRWGLKNNLGDVILEPAWEFVSVISPQDRFIVKKNGKWGVVRGDGGQVLPMKYDLISVFDENRGLYNCKVDRQYSLLDEESQQLHIGNESLKVVTAPGRPFDIIYDSAFCYDRESFKPINNQGVRFAVIETATANYIWTLENGICSVLNSSGEVLSNTPYSDFRPSSQAVPVQKDGKWGLASADGATELVPCTFAGVRTGENFFALNMPGGTGGILFEITGG